MKIESYTFNRGVVKPTSAMNPEELELLQDVTVKLNNIQGAYDSVLAINLELNTRIDQLTSANSNITSELDELKRVSKFIQCSNYMRDHIVWIKWLVAVILGYATVDNFNSIISTVARTLS